MKRFLLVSLIATFSLSAQQWTFLSNPDANYPCNYITSTNGKLYIGHNQGVFVSTDNGASWTSLTNGFGASSSSSFRQVIVEGNNIIVASTALPYNSTNSGSTWRIDTVGMNLPLGFGIGETKTIFSDGSIVLASIVSTNYIPRLYRRNLADSVWQKIDNVSSPRGFAKIGDTLYAAGYYDGLFSSTDNGATWNVKANSGFPKNDLGGFAGSLLVAHNNMLFVGYGNGVMRSTDFGATWVKVDKNFAKAFGLFSNVNAIYSDGAKLYAGVWTKDSAYVSTDNGDTWTDISTGLNSYITSFTSYGGDLYATSFFSGSNGVFKFGNATNVDGRIEATAPFNFSLEQNYPNPFNPTTVIGFKVPVSGFTSLKVYDIVGREVATLVSEVKEAGSYEMNFDASNLSSGIYFYQLRAGNFVETKRMMLIK